MSAEEDNLIMEDDNNDLDRVHEREVEVPDQQSGGEDGEIKSDVEEASKENKPVKPKRIVRNPRPKLNADTLKGPKGLKMLPELFGKVKFKGKGYEENDLNTLLKTYKYWCHRMIPKFTFDECIEKFENLGNKKPVINLIRKVRAGLMIDEPVIQFDEVDNAQLSPQSVENEPVDNRFDDLQQESQPIELSDEQLEVIRANRERAQQLRDNLRKAREKAEAGLPTTTINLPVVDIDDADADNNDVESSSDEETVMVSQKKQPTVTDNLGDIPKETNVLGIQSASQKKKRALNLPDSSDDDSPNQGNNEENHASQKKKRALNPLDSSDEEDSSNHQINEEASASQKKKRALNILDSSDEDDSSNHQINVEEPASQKKNRALNIAESSNHQKTEETHASQKKKRALKLLDSSGDDDSSNHQNNEHEPAPQKKKRVLNFDGSSDEVAPLKEQNLLNKTEHLATPKKKITETAADPRKDNHTKSITERTEKDAESLNSNNQNEDNLETVATHDIITTNTNQKIEKSVTENANSKSNVELDKPKSKNADDIISSSKSLQKSVETKTDNDFLADFDNDIEFTDEQLDFIDSVAIQEQSTHEKSIETAGKEIPLDDILEQMDNDDFEGTKN